MCAGPYLAVRLDEPRPGFVLGCPCAPMRVQDGVFGESYFFNPVAHPLLPKLLQFFRRCYLLFFLVLRKHEVRLMPFIRLVSATNRLVNTSATGLIKDLLKSLVKLLVSKQGSV
jgi:hypothetical protein